MFKSSVIVFCFNLNLWLFELLTGEPQTAQFYDFGTFERALSSKNQVFSYLETLGHLKEIKKNSWSIFKSVIFINLKMLELQHFENLRKDGCRKIPKIILMNS